MAKQEGDLNARKETRAKRPIAKQGAEMLVKPDFDVIDCGGWTHGPAALVEKQHLLGVRNLKWSLRMMPTRN
jgi:hypothetical protein